MKLPRGSVLIVASHNPGKVREIKALLGPHGIEPIGAEGVRDEILAFVASRPPAALMPFRRYRSGDQRAVVVEIGCSEAACLRSASKCSGNFFPRFAARRRMPLQAVALKKYRCGTSPVSKMSDNEHATAPLWNSEVLSVKNPVGEPIPELPQPSEEGSKHPSSVD